MSNPGSGVIGVVIGIFLIVLGYYILISRLNPSQNRQTEANLNLYALKASLYLVIGGILMVLLGLIVLSQLL